MRHKKTKFKYAKLPLYQSALMGHVSIKCNWGKLHKIGEKNYEI